MVLTATAASGCATGGGGSASALATNRPADSAAGCTAYAYRAIRAHDRLTTVPATCQALTPSQRNGAVALAIRMASGTGSKSAWRRQARAAAAYVSALITGPAPIMTAPSAGSAPGGTLATFCCSHHVGADLFLDSLLSAAYDTRHILRRVATYAQSPDHPVIPMIPETEYLKGFAFEKVR